MNKPGHVITSDELLRDHEMRTRLQKLIIVTQRTDLIKHVIQSDISLGRLPAALKFVAEEVGLEYAPPRGLLNLDANIERMTAEMRYHAGVVLMPVFHLIAQEAVGGVARPKSRQNHLRAVDLLIASYSRHIAAIGVNADSAPISFRDVYAIWLHYPNASKLIEHCSNCDAKYIYSKKAVRNECPVCKTLSLAKPRQTKHRHVDVALNFPFRKQA